MTVMTNRRSNLAAIAVLLVFAVGLPAESLAGQSASDNLKTEQKTSKRRPASDQISAGGPCVPGSPGYDPDQCRRDIMK